MARYPFAKLPDHTKKGMGGYGIGIVLENYWHSYRANIWGTK